MPTYDYECDACGEKFEKFQSITARAIRKCPSCGKLAVRRLIGAGAGVIFKGSGFYQTDYRSESYRKSAASEKSPAGDKSGGDGKASSETSTATASSESASSKPSAAAEKADKAGKSEKAESTGKSK